MAAVRAHSRRADTAGKVTRVGIIVVVICMYGGREMVVVFPHVVVVVVVMMMLDGYHSGVDV